MKYKELKKYIIVNRLKFIIEFMKKEKAANEILIFTQTAFSGNRTI